MRKRLWYGTVSAVFLACLIITGGCGEDKKSEGLAVSPQNPTMNVGDTLQFTVISNGQDVTSAVSWQVSDGCVYMDNNGLATAFATGTTKITASYNNDAVWTNITILPGGGANLNSVVISPAATTIAVGGTQQFTATGYYSDGSSQNLTAYATWNSGSTSVASINTSGLALGIQAGTSAITASYGGMTDSVTLTVSDGGGGGAPSNTISADINSPSVVSLASTTTFSIPGNTLGYADFPTADGMAYGMYLTNAGSLLFSIDAGYNSGGNWVDNGVSEVNPAGTNDLVLGFKAGAADYLARISSINISSGSTVTFDFVVREAALGASSIGSPALVSLGTSTWIAAAFNAGDFSFVAAGATATVQFDSLTAGVDVEVLTEDRLSTVFTKTADGTETQLTKTVNITGLTNGTTYVLRVSSHVFGTSGASVGMMTITSP